MASLFVSTSSSSSLTHESCHNLRYSYHYRPISPNTLKQTYPQRFRSPLRFSPEDDRFSESVNEAPSPVAIAEEQNENENASPFPEGSVEEEEKKSKQQEMDWKTDEEFKKFMGNPSIEAANKLEKTRTDRKLKELNRASNNENPIIEVFNSLARDSLAREKERLEKAEESFKALDLNKADESLLIRHDLLSV